MSTHARPVAAAILLLGVAIAAGSARAQDTSPDRHRTFQEHCARCHQHAGTVGEQLEIADGVLRGKISERDIRAFLAAHHPPPRPGQIEALYRLLRRHAEAAGQFRERCAICHDHARELARLELIVVDGRLRGRYTGRDIGEFLANHGRLDAAGVEFFVDLLSRMARDAASGD